MTSTPFDPSRPAQRIVCLTEESTEWLYLLGREDRIVGISGYTVRPPRARQEKPKVSAFLSAKIEKIVALEPDLVIGFSDLQADIAATLIRAGINVMVFNQRSVAQIVAMLRALAMLVDAHQEGEAWITETLSYHQQMRQLVLTWPQRPRVYFEEWDEPPISAIAWVSELIQLAGGADVFPELAAKPMGRDRIIADPLEVVRRSPELILGSWCGKKFRPETLMRRPGWGEVPALINGHVFEIKSADILQPGPAALRDGLAQIHARVAACAGQAMLAAPKGTVHESTQRR